MTSVPMLHTDRCFLTEVTSVDIPMLREILDDTETRCFLSELCMEFQTSESLQQFISTFDKYLCQSEGILWGIRLDKTLIGFIAIMDISAYPSLFYAIHPRYRNRHLLTESLSVVLDYLDSNHICSDLNTEVALHNNPSLRILASKGFIQTSTNGKVHYLKKFLDSFHKL